MSGHTSLGDGREFDAIRDLLARWGPLARGIGDDGALLDVPPGERLVVSTDASIENVHFRATWMSPAEIGWRATTAALSDLAAMAARPLGVLTALTVPERWRSALPELADGIGEAASAAGAAVIGGDLNAGTELCIAVTVLGSTAKPLTRSGANAGDSLWVTGQLGGPAIALRAWLDGSEPARAERERFVQPQARVREALWLAAHGATAAIDISDGLIADARHMAAASGAAISIALDNVPLFGSVSPADAAASGEEYELLIAAHPTLDAAAFAAEFGLPLTRIGNVTGGTAVGVTVTHGGARVEFGGGHDHFSR